MDLSLLAVGRRPASLCARDVGVSYGGLTGERIKSLPYHGDSWCCAYLPRIELPPDCLVVFSLANCLSTQSAIVFMRGGGAMSIGSSFGRPFNSMPDTLFALRADCRTVPEWDVCANPPSPNGPPHQLSVRGRAQGRRRCLAWRATWGTALLSLDLESLALADCLRSQWVYYRRVSLSRKKQWTLL